MNNVSRMSFVALCVGAVLMAAAPACADDGPKKPHLVARDAGCMVCHEVESPAPGESLLPMAPSFEQIARRYQADPQAADDLASTVRDGTGPLRRDRHWQGKASFDRMYPNAVTEEEARTIVDWILTLSPAPSSERTRHAQRH